MMNLLNKKLLILFKRLQLVAVAAVFSLFFAPKYTLADIFTEELPPECEIPETAEIIHYPMIHNPGLYPTFTPPPLTQEAVISSQWRLMKILEKNSDIYYFDEGASHSMELNQSYFTHLMIKLNRYIYGFKTLRNVQLFNIGGGWTGYFMGYIDKIHRTKTPEEEEEFLKKMMFLQLKDVFLKQKKLSLTGSAYVINENAKNIINQLTSHLTEEEVSSLKQEVEKIKSIEEIEEKLKNIHIQIFLAPFQKRELYAKREVETLLNELSPGHHPVLIAYGATHDFSDDFSSYNFYRLPISCSMPYYFLFPLAEIIIKEGYHIIEIMHNNHQNVSYSNGIKNQLKYNYELIYTVLTEMLKNYNENETYWNSILEHSYSESEIDSLAQIAHQISLSDHYSEMLPLAERIYDIIIEDYPYDVEDIEEKTTSDL